VLISALPSHPERDGDNTAPISFARVSFTGDDVTRSIALRAHAREGRSLPR
jgi:hypothetical protein